MKPKWQKLASLAQEICTLLFQFFGAVFASKGYPFKNILINNFSDTLFKKKVQQLYSKYEYFPVILLLTNHATFFNINIVLSIHPPFEPISALFTIKGL